MKNLEVKPGKIFHLNLDKIYSHSFGDTNVLKPIVSTEWPWHREF